MTPHLTAKEMEASLGASLKALRLDLNIDQRTVAEQAGISIGALQHLENGKGSTVKSLVSVLRALGRADWPTTIAPLASVNPLNRTESANPRQRAAPARAARA